MSVELRDRKNRISMFLLGALSRVCVSFKFPEQHIVGLENIPESGPFLMISNHTSRWDALVTFNLVKRSANFMTSPNELKGFQGAALRSVGAFPAHRNFELDKFITKQAAKGEAIVIFPEGNIYRDGTLHPFKKGAAHLVSACSKSEITLPILPVAIEYSEGMMKIIVSPPMPVANTSAMSDAERRIYIESLTQEMHNQVSRSKARLGYLGASFAQTKLQHVG